MRFLKMLRSRVSLAVLAFCVVVGTTVPALLPSAASAESATAEKVKEVAHGVGTEGVEIVLVILTALISLLVAVIIIPKAIALIKRFI